MTPLPMDRANDDSLLFSLNALLARETERVALAAEQARLRAEAEARLERERKEAERAAREAREEARRRAEADAIRAHEERERMLAVKRAAEIERARVEAESRARLELEQSRQAHERAIEELKSRAARSRDRVALVVTSVLLALSTIGGLALYFGRILPDHRRLVAACETRLGAVEARAVDGEKRLALAARREAELRDALDDLRQRAAPEQAAPRPKSPSAAAPAPARTPRSNRGAERVVCPNDGDPLNGCMP